MSYTYDYPRLMLTVDAVVFRKNKSELEVLLIRRKHDPFEDFWALPGGFVDMDETCEQAIFRELEEETNLRFTGLSQLHTFSDLNRDPRGRTVSVTFFGIIDIRRSRVKAGDDASDAKWFRINNLPRIAFDHDEVIEMALNRI